MTWPAYSKMKQTEDSFLGAVPAHWNVKPGRAFLREKNAKNIGSASTNYLSLMANRGIILYAEKGDVGNKKPEDLSKCKIVITGDFVINSMNYAIGSYGVSPYDGVCSPVYVVMEHNPFNSDPRFVHYVLSNKEYQTYAQSFGTGILDHRRAIGWDEIKLIPVALPPVAEQMEIGRFLDRKLATIDSLIEKKGRFIKLLKEKRSATISQGVTKGLEASTPSSGPNSALDSDIPSHWTPTRLRFTADVSNSNVDKKSYDDQSPVKLCNYTDVYYNDFITPSIEFMKATASDHEIACFELRKGDVIITKDSEDPNDIGVPAYVVEDMPGVVCGYHLSVIRTENEGLAAFIFYSIQSHRNKAHFYVETPGVTRYGLDQDTIKNIIICLPPKHEAREIVRHLRRETDRLDLLVAKTKRSIELLKEHRSALITAAVTGKIDVRNAA